jgi:hypothetical protein
MCKGVLEVVRMTMSLKLIFGEKTLIQSNVGDAAIILLKTK